MGNFTIYRCEDVSRVDISLVSDNTGWIELNVVSTEHGENDVKQYEGVTLFMRHANSEDMRRVVRKFRERVEDAEAEFLEKLEQRENEALDKLVSSDAKTAEAKL